MKLVSRESKMIVGLALLALGIYLWFNFLGQNNASFLPSFLGGDSSSQVISSPRTDNPRVSNPSPRVSTQPTVSNNSQTTTGSSELAAPLADNTQAIRTVNPNIDNSVATTAREVIIVDLPFLITEAPVEDLLATDATEEGESAAQNRALRATVNPFSPIIIEEDETKNNVSASTPVQNVPGQSRPTSVTHVGNTPGTSSNTSTFKAPTELIESAPLRTVTPAPALANSLPRTLATGTLNVTPGILRSQNIVPPLASEVAAAEEAEAERLAQVKELKAQQETAAEEIKTQEAALAEELKAQQAALAEEIKTQQEEVGLVEANKPLPVLNNSTVRMPQNNTTNLPIAATIASAPSSNTLPNILATGRDAQNIPITVTAEATNPQTNEAIVTVVDNAEAINGTDNPQDALADPSTNGGPLEAGGSDLSRYLRDNNFQYTGSVRGVVSVGMFRTSVQAITITLGQTIPKTDIVLTDLQNNQAEFTQGQDKVILNLDLRR